MSRRRLIACWLGEDMEAFGDVVSRYQRMVLSLAYARLGNWHDAEDAAQEAFIAAYRNLRTLREPERFAGWLRRLALTACKRAARGVRPLTVPLDESALPGGGTNHCRVEEAELRDAIMSALRSLSPGNRICTSLHFLDGYSVKEVAASLDLPEGTVKRRLHDSRKHLQAQMIPFATTARRGTMTKELEGLTWQCAWTSHMGCVKGCLNWLRQHGTARERQSSATNMSLPWLFGGTGHAFVVNLHDEVCPSGPTAWNTEMLYHLAPNLGYRLTVVWSQKGHPDFPAKQEAAWAYLRGCIDKNIPCYGWELRVPEFYTIHGYDEVGYYYRGPGADEGAGPKPWRELGATDIACLELYSVQVCEPASDAVAVRAALQFALDHAERPGKWVFPKYHTGPEAFAAWADALEQGRALRFGQGYNGEVWAECRGQAVSFLREAKDRLAGKAPGLFDEAIEHYSTVHARLKNVRDLHPFHEPGSGELDRLKSPDAAGFVREAGEAERKGLETLRKIVGALSS